MDLLLEKNHQKILKIDLNIERQTFAFFAISGLFWPFLVIFDHFLTFCCIWTKLPSWPFFDQMTPTFARSKFKWSQSSRNKPEVSACNTASVVLGQRFALCNVKVQKVKCKLQVQFLTKLYHFITQETWVDGLASGKKSSKNIKNWP